MTNILFRLAVIATIILVVLIPTTVKNVSIGNQEPEDVYDADFDISEHGTGGRIETTLDYVLDWCGYETKENKTYGITTSSYTVYYYIIPVNGKGEYDYFICVEVPESKQHLYEAMADNTWEYFDTGNPDVFDTYVDFTGTLEELDEEIYGYMVDWFKEANVFDSEADLKQYVLPIVLTSMNFDISSKLIFACIIVLLFTILLWALYINSRRNNVKVEGQRQTQSSYVPSNDNSYTLYDSSQNYASGYSSSNYTYGTNPIPANAATVSIKGVSCSKSALDAIDSYICTNQDFMAIQEIRRITGFGEDEAKEIVDNWYMYYK